MNHRTSTTLALLVFAAGAHAQSTELVSVGTHGEIPDGLTTGPGITPDGRYVVFDSHASNLGTSEPHGNLFRRHVYLRDRIAGTTETVTLNNFGTPGDFPSQNAVLSDDARYITFDTWATNLVFVDEENYIDVVALDRATGEWIYVSIGAGKTVSNGDSGWPSISADGRFIAYMSNASNLVANDTNNAWDVFVFDVQTRTNEKISQGSGFSTQPSISKDGRFVAYESTNALDPADTNGQSDVYVYDRSLGTTVLVSRSDLGEVGDAPSQGPAISGDGRFVAFHGASSNLVPNDTNGSRDVFLRDLLLDTIVRVSVDSNGAQGNADSRGAKLSHDGGRIGFESQATNLVPGDKNGVEDVFLHDLASGLTERVSVAESGAEAKERNNQPRLTGQGQFVAFMSDDALVPADDNGHCDIYLRGPSVSLWVDGPTKTAGDGVDFTTYDGLPHGVSLLWLIEVNDVPDFHRVDVRMLDGSGQLTRSFVVPPGLAGQTFTFVDLCQDEGGRSAVTNTVDLEFR